jgi:hypothetical protein
VSITDGAGNRVRAPETGYAAFHVLPALAPYGLSLDTAGQSVVLGWRPPAGEIASHQYNPYVSIVVPAAVRVYPPYLPARLLELYTWLERPDSTSLYVDFYAPDSAGLPGQELHPGFVLNSYDTMPGWAAWDLDSLGIEFTGNFYLGLEAQGRGLWGDGSSGAYRTVVKNGSSWEKLSELGELCAHVRLGYPQAEVLYQVQRATADSAYRKLADSLIALNFIDSAAGPEARHRYLVKSLWTQPKLYSSSLPISIVADWQGPRIGDSLAVLFGDSMVVVGASVRDGFGVAWDSVQTPSGYTSDHDSVSEHVHWYVLPAVAVGDTAMFALLAQDSSGNVTRSPESAWHLVVNTGVGAIPGQNLPTCFGLSKAFPNPSRNGCFIKYQLPKNTPVSLVVYNLAGQRVRTLEEGMKQVGYYQVRWDGRDEGNKKAAAGVYFYRLKSEGYQRTERLVVVR